MSNYWTTA